MLKIVNGQFVDESGNIVKPEFGNREQVDALKSKLGDAWYLNKNFNKANAVDEWFEGVMKMEIKERTTYTFYVDFNCPKCGNNNSIECDDEFEDWEPDKDDLDDFLNNELECEHCNHKFSYEHTRRDEYKIVSIPDQESTDD